MIHKCGLLLLVVFATAKMQAQTTHYRVKLEPDFERHLLRGEEEIEFQRDTGQDSGLIHWQKQSGLQILSAKASEGSVSARDTSVRGLFHAGGSHWVRLLYTASEGRGISWFAARAGFNTAFYCEAWMVCDNTPAQRATLRLEIVLPSSYNMTAVGPGSLSKQWRDKEGEHFVFEQSAPVQTYLFSFAVAQLQVETDGQLSLYVKTASHRVALRKTADAYAFLRGKATVAPINSQYVQAFLPGGEIGQEAAGLALMSDSDLRDLETKDDVALMAHEAAHQWWGVLVGIRSWSDFWLNEGLAEFMADAYLEEHQGKAAYLKQIAATKERMRELREKGMDRPLHWDGWRDAHE
ncbi:MAG: M1 family aminopeptidase, partial [Bryobacteraceae bacterium]